MSQRNPQTDIKLVIKNLKDLDDVATGLLEQYKKKNEVLETGLKICQQHLRYLDALRNPKN
jgi:hypothetical protein